MSLDVYLYEPTPCPHCNGPVRGCQIYDANITHNLGKMADEAGIYLALWRPGEMKAPDIHKQIREQQDAGNYHGKGGVLALEKLLPVVFASDLVGPLKAGLALLKSDRRRFEEFNAKNGWGTYRHFVLFVEQYIDACSASPSAIVEVSR